MALDVCRKCGTRYAAGLASCPHCGGKRYRPDWEEDEMPKTTYAGDSYEEGKEPPGWAPPPEPEAAPEAAPEPEAPAEAAPEPAAEPVAEPAAEPAAEAEAPAADG